MSTKGKIIKEIYSFFSAAGDIFTSYMIIIGILTLVVFHIDMKLQEVLTLARVFQIYIVLFGVYIAMQGLKFYFISEGTNTLILKRMAYLFISFVYLSLMANTPQKLIVGFATCFIVKMLIVVFVKIKKYPTECIGYVLKKHID